jgi:hypothetical protein
MPDSPPLSVQVICALPLSSICSFLMACTHAKMATKTRQWALHTV